MLNIFYFRGAFTFLVGILLVSTPKTWADPGFWEHWGDARAEISGYRLSVPRYGQMREGEAVLIYVTEDLSSKTQVKIDRKVNEGEKVPVLKLNHLRRFPTGIYDYQMMSSVFTPVREWQAWSQNFPVVTPIKVSFSSTEWCGVYYQQLNQRRDGVHDVSHSYFDGEADSRRVHPVQEKSFFEDDLFIRVRELNSPFSSGRYQMLSSAMYSRLSHTPLGWRDATVERSSESKMIVTGIGTVEATLFQIDSVERLHRIWVEGAYPRRVLKWESLYRNLSNEAREVGEITGSFRSDYWRQNSLGDEKLRAQLRLP